jgi:hypothetical protein
VAPSDDALTVAASGHPPVPPGGFEPDLDKWDAWRPEEASRRLAGVAAPWCVAAGWAIDLFLGDQRREHEDLELAVPADQFGEIAAALAGFELFVVGSGRGWRLEDADAPLETYWQTWVLDPAADKWRLDVFRDQSDGDTWICRRDDSIRMPYERLIERTADGIPYQRPEVVLLFKAKHARPRDEGDLAAALPRLEPDRRRWLADALELVHPGHAWIERVR